MNENEYIDYYCQHLLVKVILEDKTGYYDNDISTINYNEVLQNAKEWGISKDSFISNVKYYAKQCKRQINFEALWKLSIVIWSWKMFHPIFMNEPRDVDKLIKLNLLRNLDMKVENITIIGKRPDKKKRDKIVLSSDEVITNILHSLFNDDFLRLLLSDKIWKHYPIDKPRSAYEILENRTIAFQIARELTGFFCHFFGMKKVDSATKNLIMEILFHFSLLGLDNPQNKPQNKHLDNTDYNKLFSDAKTGRLPICDHCYKPTIINNTICDFTILKSPNSVWNTLESAKE